MKLKVKVDTGTGSVYVAAINADGEHRKSATLEKGQELEIELMGIDEGGIVFGDLVTEEAEETPATENTVDAGAPAGGEGETPESPTDPESPGPDASVTTPEKAEPASSDERPKATPGRIVLFRAEEGVDVPAIVSATEEGDGNPLTLTLFPKSGPVVIDGVLEAGQSPAAAHDGDEPAVGTWRWPERS